MSPTRLRQGEIIRKWKKTYLKKSKDTSHISIRAFNKKNNKIYYQHYDDDAKNTTNDFFNYDCLAEILTYFPACEKPKIASVCKKWKKTCVKKPKVTSHISIRAFNEKDNKTYYQHYGDDVKNTTIDFVNDDCLAEIFTYLPACERPKIASVCKKWEQALGYSWQNVKKLELTHWEYNECPSYLKNYPEIYGQVQFLRSLLDKCGRYLTELDLTAHGYNDIVPVINESCSNLVKLRLRFKNGEPPLDAFSRLSKLKVLKIIFQHVDNDYISDTLINSLRSVAGTLTELTLSNWNKEQLYKSLKIPKSFIHVIPELKALKSIETAGILIDTNSSMHLKKLGVLVISHDKRWLLNTSHNTFQYKSVTKLDLKDYQATDDCLYTIANCLENLDALTTFCERVTDVGIVAISKMSNLTYLHLRGPSHVTDSSIKLLKNLKFLHLPYSNKITDVSITEVFENSPEIKTFYFVDSAVSSEFIKKIAKIATNRKISMKMGLLYKPGITQYESQYLHLVLLNSLKKMVYWSINFKDI